MGGRMAGARSPRRNELLHALREAQDAALNDTAAWATAPVSVPEGAPQTSASCRCWWRRGRILSGRAART